MKSGKAASVGAIDVALIKAAKGEGCPRCGGKVFMAEEINARGRVSLRAKIRKIPLHCLG